MRIAAGLEAFKTLAADARPKVIALKDAVVAGDVEAAKTAYINSRNEYEQIEVLAPGFGDVDCSIDCRACVAAHVCAEQCLRLDTIEMRDLEQCMQTHTTTERAQVGLKLSAWTSSRASTGLRTFCSGTGSPRLLCRTLKAL